MKKLIFVLLFFFHIIFGEILLNQAHFVGQELEILVQDGKNQTLEVKKPDGSFFEKQLDNSGQARIFLDQEGIWEFSFGAESKKLLVQSLEEKTPTKKNEEQTENLFLFFLILAFLFLIFLIFFGIHLYKNLTIKGPELYKTKRNGFVCITFQASKDLLEDVILQINFKEGNPVVLSKKTLLPFEKLSYECEEEVFLSASCTFSENKKNYNAFISSQPIEEKESGQKEQEVSFPQEQKPIKRKLKKLS
ncbi:MAG: hypothetical protein ACK4J0_03310 [Candidatus Anstonellaceae archaeon]